MARLRLLDLWGPLLALAGVAVFVLRGFEGPLSHDVALYAYSAQQLADGVPPYVSVLNRAGPLAHLVPGLGALAGEATGVDQLLAMRVTLAGVAALGVWATYLLGRDVFASRAAGATAAATLLLFEGFVTYATTGPREKTTMVLFMVLALWLLCRQRWVGVGVAVALATLTWQGTFVPLAAAALVVAVAQPGPRATLVALARIAVGGLSVTALAVAAFLAAGALREFYQGFLGIHLTGIIRQAGLLTTLRDRPQVLVNGFGWSLWVGLAGTVAVLALGAVGVRTWRRDRAGAAMAVGLALGTVMCLVWSLGAFQGWPDVFFFLPFATMGVCGLLHQVVSRLPDRWALPASAGFVAVSLVLAGASAATNRSTELRAQRGLAVGLVGLAGPGATMQSVGAPQPLVLTGLRNPIRYQLVKGGLGVYLDQALPEGLAGIARGVDERRPTFLVVEAPPNSYPWLRPVLTEGYERLGNDGAGTAWFATEALPDDTVRRMRALVRQGPGSVGRPTVRRSLP